MTDQTNTSTEQTETPKFDGQRRQVRAVMVDLMNQGLTANEAASGLMVEAVNLMSTLEGPEFAAAWLNGIAAKLEAENDVLGTKH
jgi:hypothetical protein